MLFVNVFPLFFYVCFVQRVVGVRALSNSTDPPKEKTKDQGKKEMHISHLQQSISLPTIGHVYCARRKPRKIFMDDAFEEWA